MTDYTRFSDETELQSGHYLALYLRGKDQTGAEPDSVTVSAVGGSSSEIANKFGDDGMIESLYTLVIRIEDTTSPIRITANYNTSGETITTDLDVSELVLAS